MSTPLSLRDFIALVRMACLERIEAAGFGEDQKRLLDLTTEKLFVAIGPDDWGQPLGLFFAVYRAAGGKCNETAVRLGQFCAFYILSADLFDDVQDDDLAGKPHEEVGSAIAINSALTLLTLALDALGEASVHERRPKLRFRYLRLFNRVSLLAVGAQHRDLMGAAGARTREEIAAMHRGKTSSVALICECAALVGGALPKQAEKFYRMGEELAAAVQIVDDVRDLVAKSESVDLLTGKATFPLACFYERASPSSVSQLQELLQRRPIDLDAVTNLFEQAGVFDACAEAVESHRRRIAWLLDLNRTPSAHRRILQKIVDHLAGVLYDPEPIDQPSPPYRLPVEVRAPAERGGAGLASHLAQQAARDFGERMAVYGFGDLPTIEPWHLPICLYQPEQNRIYFSDLDGLPEEVLPFHADLLGWDEERTARGVLETLPFLIAHELTHAWRDQLGLLSKDAWFEEEVANEVAFAYVARHAPEAADAVVRLSQRIVELAEREPSATDQLTARAIRGPAAEALANEAVPNGAEANERDYDVTPAEGARVHARMLLTIAARSPSLPQAVATWLKPEQPLAAE